MPSHIIENMPIAVPRYSNGSCRLSFNYHIHDIYRANIDVVFVHEQLLILKFVKDLDDDGSVWQIDVKKSAFTQFIWIRSGSWATLNTFRQNFRTFSTQAIMMKRTRTSLVRMSSYCKVDMTLYVSAYPPGLMRCNLLT